MWVETKKNNEQLRKEVEVAKEELSSTKKKLEEALVVCTMYTDLYHSFVCINKVLNRSTRFPATLQRFSPQDRYHLIFKPHWIKQQKRKNCCLIFQAYWFRQQQWKILPGRVGASAETGQVGEREAEGEVGSCESSDAGANNTSALSILFWKSIFGGSFPVIGLSHQHWSD